MGRNKRTTFVDNNGANSDTDSVPVSKKPRKSESSPKKPAKEEKTARKVNTSGSRNDVTSTTNVELKKVQMQNIYSDSSSSSDSDSEKTPVKNDKKSDKSGSDSNSDSDSDSESDSSESDSSQASKADKSDCKVVNNVSGCVTNTADNSINYGVVKAYDSPKSSGSDSYHSDTEEEDKKRRKKQKELLKMQLNKKTNKRATPKKQNNFLSSSEVTRDTEDLKDEDDSDEGHNSDGDIADWPKRDIYELIQRMEEQIPDGDTQKFDSRAARLDWEAIAFGNHSKEDCIEIWNQIAKRIRRYRNLSEMLADAREWAKKPGTNFCKGSKKKRLPDIPSKALSAYMLYFLEHKDKVTSENEGVDLMQISKIIAEMYKKLSNEEREKYSQKLALEKKKFEEKIVEFYKDHPEFEPPSQTRSNNREIVKGPRKPNAPFKLFFQEELKNFSLDGSVDRKTMEESAKEKWKGLSDKKKAVWINLSLQDFSRYEKELKSYQKKNPDYVGPSYNKSILNKEERSIMERLSGKPVKPPNSAYSLFSRHMLQSDNDVKSKAPKLRMAEISRKWKELQASERYRYVEKVKQLQEEYKTKLQSYLRSLTPEERQKEVEFVTKLKRKKKEKSNKKLLKNSKMGMKTRKSPKKASEYSFYEGEPKPPPVKTYDLFVEKFVASRPAGMSEETRRQQAPKQWEKLSSSKREALEEELERLKMNYIAEFGGFLKDLSKDEIKQLTLRRGMPMTERQDERVNGTLSDSNDDSDDDKPESSSECSDSDDSKSSNCSSSGESDG